MTEEKRDLLSLVVSNDPAAPTMSSHEVAELVNSRHDNVKRTIETLVQSRVIAIPQSEELPRADGMPGKPLKVYHLDKRSSLIVVARISPEFTARVVDRWQELEAQAHSLPDFSDPAAAARAWADEIEAKRAAQHEVQRLLPMEAALERISIADGTVTVTSAAKLLQMRPKDLFQWLRERKWIYRRTGSGADLGYQNRVQAGLLEHKTTTISRSDGSEKITEQVRITAKGLALLAKRVSEGEMP